MAPVEIYERCVATMDADPKPSYAVYVMHVEARHLDVVSGYNTTGSPTTTLNFGPFYRRATYRVWYRARDQKSVMQNAASNARFVVPPVPWSLDLTTLPASTQNSSNESITAHGAAIDQVTQLLSEIYTDEKDAYHISLVGVEEHGGRRAYHLALENVGGDPNDHALRKLVVDATTFRPLEVVIQVGQRSMLFGGGLTLSADFSAVGEYWLSTSGSVIGTGHVGFIHVHGTYTYKASDFLFPSALPESMFK